MAEKKSKGLWIGIGVVVILVIAGFFAFSGEEESSGVNTANVNDVDANSGQAGSDSGDGNDDQDAGENPAWMEIELKDVNSGESYTISELKGKPMLIESFAVWCPICTKQQNNIKELHEEPGFSEEELISIALDTDPNEDEAKVAGHASSNGFDWRYSVAPVELTQSLIDEFGNGIVNPPSVPMILVCEDGSYRKLGGFGARDVDKLKTEIAAGC